MPTEPRELPPIPDHEVTRKIGSGSYGEVWLARSVTGAWRAVKIVRRADFDDERTFEREFEGIRRYEPISREHPSLVHVLHVGRLSEPAPCYFYLMELGDDLRTGQRVNPVEYEPRTLRAEGVSQTRDPLPIDTVIDVGIALAGGLEHLHQHGLAHRDVKPANVIFVQGRAKLADIGLVAVRDQRTFVGTEGFVPPEGPGSAAADIYSLGKVLYELATGLDRLEFPELPDKITKGESMTRWRQLNDIICETCEPRKEFRRINTGAQLQSALEALRDGRKVRFAARSQQRSGMFIGSLVGILLISALSFILWNNQQATQPAPLTDIEPPLAPQPTPSNNNAANLINDPFVTYGERSNTVQIMSNPQFAKISRADGSPIYDISGNLISESGGAPFLAPSGTEFRLRFELDGYKTLVTEETFVVPEPDQPPLEIEMQLNKFLPPILNERWTDSMGMDYTPARNGHLSDRSIDATSYQTFASATGFPTEVPTIERNDYGKIYKSPLLTSSVAKSYADWLKTRGLADGTLSVDHDLHAIVDERLTASEKAQLQPNEDLVPYRILVERIDWAKVLIDSRPTGATVLQNGKILGVTSPQFRIDKVTPGKNLFTIQLEGFRRKEVEFEIAPGGFQEFFVELEANDSAIFGKPWTNSLGMKLVPLGNDLLVSQWETRVIDFHEYCNANESPLPPPPAFEQTPEHPVVNVTKAQAEAFCVWLTTKEREAEKINERHQYRLPTDAEWSLMNGFEERASTPRKRHGRRNVYPWGETWPPPTKPSPVGNFADQQAARQLGISPQQVIPNYADGFAATAPVGSFRPNYLDIYDLAGNVQEWIGENYGEVGSFATRAFTRGGGFRDQRDLMFDLGHRHIPEANTFKDDIGFRVVLSREIDQTTVENN